MHALLSMLLTLLCLANTGVPGDAPVAETVLAVACDDCLDFFLLLDDPGVQTRIVDVADFGEFTLVAAVHSFADAIHGSDEWAAIYTFPTTIFAHSIVKVPFHAEEMD